MHMLPSHLPFVLAEITKASPSWALIAAGGGQESSWSRDTSQFPLQDRCEKASPKLPSTFSQGMRCLDGLENGAASV